MVVRIFLVLLVFNLLAFVVRAEAEERVIVSDLYPEDLSELQERMSGDYERHDADRLAELGSRLLSWQFSKTSDDKPHYASRAITQAHAVALIEEGACLNFKWNF